MFKGWRTLTANIAVFLFSALVALAQILVEIGSMPEIQALVPAGAWPWFTAGLAVLNILLRLVTTTPAGRRE